jgi:ribosomal protein L32
MLAIPKGSFSVSASLVSFEYIDSSPNKFPPHVECTSPQPRPHQTHQTHQFTDSLSPPTHYVTPHHQHTARLVHPQRLQKPLYTVRIQRENPRSINSKTAPQYRISRQRSACTRTHSALTSSPAYAGEKERCTNNARSCRICACGVYVGEVGTVSISASAA